MIRKCVEAIEKLSDFFSNADNEIRRNVVAAIFPDKLTWTGDSFRTTRLDEPVRLIFNVDKGFGGIANKNPSAKNKKSSMDTANVWKNSEKALSQQWMFELLLKNPVWLWKSMLARVSEIKKVEISKKISKNPLPLPDLDSNQDKLNQNQLYYPYTIGQSAHS